MMTELEQLLSQAGHLEPHHGNRWTCKDCPEGKQPALSVDVEVYFCHRCGVGGNIITLRKELGLKSTLTPKSYSEVIEDKKVSYIFETATRILFRWRNEYHKRFKWTAAQAYAYNKIGRHQCATQGFADNDILEKAYYFTQQEELLEWELNWIEKQKPEDFIDLAIDEINWLNSNE